MSLLDFFYPRTCVNCNYLGVYLCPDCLGKLAPLRQQLCFYCQRPSLYGLTHPRCKKKLGIDGSISIFRYESILKKVIHQFKYRLATSVFTEFFNSINWIEQFIYYQHLPKNTYLLPIPLSRERLLARGFNQALVVAEKINSYLGLPLGDFLVRHKDTRPQANIKDEKLRYSNLCHAFKLEKLPAVNMTVVLIDDVLTTGATLHSAAQTLKLGGIKKVYAFTLARG